MEDRDRVIGPARIAFPGDPNLLIPEVGDERQVDIEHDVEKHGDAGSDGHQLRSTNANSAPNPITALAHTVTRLSKPEISPI